MSRRTASLAQIQSYLDNPDDASAPDESVLPDEAAPHAAPGTQAEPLTKEELARQTAEAQRDRALIGKERDQLKLDKEKSALEEKTDVAAAKLQKVVNYSKFKLEGISMPGGLFLPIILLFIFFLALIPTGGHTRLQWLWQVITGNAALNQAEDLIVPAIQIKLGESAPLTTPTTPTQVPAPPPRQIITPAPAPPSGPIPLMTFFTGVEQES